MESATSSPSEYLDRLKQAHPLKSPDNDVLSIIHRKLGLSGAMAARFAETCSSTDYGDSLRDRLLPRLDGHFDSAFQSDLLAIGAIEDPTPNAHTVEVSPLRFAVVFHSGLRDFIYRVSRAMASRMHVEGHTEDCVDYPFEETCQILTDIFFWFKETGQPCGPSYEIGKWQLLLGSEIASETEVFFLAHELGHVLAQSDKGNNEQEGMPGTDARDDALAEEFSADEFALSVLLKPAGEKYPLATQQISYAGAELGPLIYAGLEGLGVEFTGSHPPAVDRLERIRAKAQEWSENPAAHAALASIASCNAIVFEKALDAIKDGEHEEFLARAADQILSEIDRLLDDCTGGTVPDYVTFRAKTGELFAKGYSHRLYERIADAAREYAEKMKRISDAASDDVMSEGWVAFQKYKLFLSMVMGMPEPAKSLFDQALETHT